MKQLSVTCLHSIHVICDHRLIAQGLITAADNQSTGVGRECVFILEIYNVFILEIMVIIFYPGDYNVFILDIIIPVI